MENFVDLHIHSAYSDDGEFTPAELVRQCRDAGLRVIAVADHNCVRANAEAQKEAERLNIFYIPAIEIDCNHSGTNLHMLGYQIDYKNDDFERLEQNILQQELTASRERLKFTGQLGFHVTEDELNTLSDGKIFSNVWTGEKFAEIILNKPEYQNNEMLFPYRKGGIRSENPYVNFYWDFYSQGKACYVEIKYPDMDEIIPIIHRNGGKAVLAHPGINLKGKYAGLDEIIAHGIDGIEAFSSYHDVSDSRFFNETARKNALMVTCGSDYHGKTKPSVRLGGSGCSVDANEIAKQFYFQ